MPVVIDELTSEVARPESRTERDPHQAENAQGAELRRAVKGMNYEEGVARLSPRSGAPTAAQSAVAPAPTQIGSGGATVTASGSDVQISASSVTINAPVTKVNGVLKADQVVAASGASTDTTPGAGNVW